MKKLKIILSWFCTLICITGFSQRIYQVQFEIANPSNCEEVLGIDTNEVSFIIYPNPAASELYIVSDSAIESIQLYDVSGKKSRGLEIQKSSTGYHVTWKNLSKGIYLLQVQQEGQIYVNQIVINP